MIKKISFGDTDEEIDKIYLVKDKMNELVDTVNYLCAYISGSNAKVEIQCKHEYEFGYTKCNKCGMSIIN